MRSVVVSLITLLALFGGYATLSSPALAHDAMTIPAARLAYFKIEMPLPPKMAHFG